MRLWVDCETFSETSISHGTYRYTWNSEVMLLPWAVDDGPVQVEDLTAGPLSDALLEAARTADEVWAHNAMFDRNALRELGIPLERWRCSMVQALAHGLPGSLDQLCTILRVPQDSAKLKDGKALVQLFCKPRPKTMRLRRATRETHPVDWRRFIEYAANDVRAMREVQRRLPSHNYPKLELPLWQLDQRINDRGFAVDVELAAAALHAINNERERLAHLTREMTEDTVQTATQRAAMIDHIADTYGVPLEDIKASTVDKLLENEALDAGLRELLEVRQQASQTSTSKYRILLNAETEGRVRGTLQYCGAPRTGRWAGRTFQPQNLPSRGLLSTRDIETGIHALKSGVADIMFDNVMKLTASCVRSCIVASPDHKLVAADLSNIEGRTLAWLAGEEWKLEAFRAFDRKQGHDLYKLAYSKGFGVKPESVTKDQRQVGKVMELALGYEGGVGAFLTFSLAYGIDLEQMAEAAWAGLPGELVDEALEFYDWMRAEKRPLHGLSQRAFATCDVFKRAWRRGHPATVSLWRQLQQAALNAVDSPGREYEVGRLCVSRHKAWLRVALPSGRMLWYPSPKIEGGKLSYMGVNQYSRKWERLNTYGGKLTENVTQAVARDVLAFAMQKVESSHFPVVLTVHDEIVTEVPDNPLFSVRSLVDFMSTPPDWADGLPLAASGFEGFRYRKD